MRGLKKANKKLLTEFTSAVEVKLEAIQRRWEKKWDDLVKSVKTHKRRHEEEDDDEDLPLSKRAKIDPSGEVITTKI